MNLVAWQEPKDTAVTQYKVTRSDRRDGTFEVIATISPALVGGAFVTEYVDSTGEKSHWYIIEYYRTNDCIAKSDPRPGEYTYASAYEMVWRLRVKLGDMQAPYCYKDYELLGHLNEALVTVGKTLTWDSLETVHEMMIMWVAMHQICLELATDSAKFYNLTIEGVTVNKADRVAHYTGLSEKYWQKFIQKRDEWAEGDKEGSGTIIETYLTRESGTTGRRVPYIHAQPPAHPRMTIGKVTAMSVELKWTQINDPGFYYYILFRAEHPNVQQAAIEDIYHKRIAALYNDITDYTPLWGNVTVPLRMIFRNSVTYWQDMNRPGMIRPYYSGAIPLLWPSRSYYYCMGVVNKNILISLSQEVKVTLPAFTPPEIWTPVYAVDSVVKGSGEPTATIEIWKNVSPGFPGYVQVGTTTIPPGYGAWNFQMPIAVGDKIKVKQTRDTLDSGFGAEVTVI